MSVDPKEILDEPFLVACPEVPAHHDPYLVKYYGTSNVRPIDAPVDTISAEGNHHALATAGSYLIPQGGGGVPRHTEDPVPTVACDGAHALSTPEPTPLIQPKNGRYGGNDSNPLFPAWREPFGTITTDPRAKLVTPYLCPMYNSFEGQRPRTRSLDRPLMTVPASKSPAGLASPFLVDYHGQSTAASIDDPLGTIETRDRYALCVPEAWPWGLDVKYRMLSISELKQAQGFPESYDLAGSTQRALKEQIGNAVPVGLAEALCKHQLSEANPSLSTFGGGLQDDDAEVPEYEEVASDD